MGKKRIIHNGVKMTEDWPAKIEAAQSLTQYTIAGQKYSRIPFGEEGHSGWGQKPCLDCAVLKGQFHVPDCEYEMCPSCRKGFAEGCRCNIEELREVGEESIAMPPQGKAGRVAERVFRCSCWLIMIVVLLALLRSILMLFGI